jgi:hypothetical protein
MNGSNAATPDVSAEHLAQGLGISVRQARRFKAAGKMPALYAMAWALAVEGDLGAAFPAWRGWAMRDGQLFAPEGYGFRPGEVRAIPMRAAQLRELEHVAREPRQFALPGLPA